MKQTMKRLTAILVALVMMLALAACSGSKDTKETAAAASDSAIAETKAADTAKSGSKMLVAFFNTRKNTTVDAAATPCPLPRRRRSAILLTATRSCLPSTQWMPPVRMCSQSRP